MSKGTLLGLLAETPLHPGAGQSADVVDLPVAREGATGLPQIPDTGLKGALRQWAREQKLADDDLFGKSDTGAGQLMISSARLLCLPIRRLDGPYAWVTTPYLLERLGRDMARMGISGTVPSFTFTGNELFWAGEAQDPVFLEEFSFAAKEFNGNDPSDLIKPLIEDQTLADRLCGQLAVMSDEEFAWYAANALPVTARNSLNENKMSKNLWYEEVIPPDALFYSVILPRNEGVRRAYDNFLQTLVNNKYLQIGGNETVGQGWVILNKITGGSDGP